MSSSHNNLLTLIALIVSPNSPCDESGTVKLSHAKTTKVSKTCADIEFLISDSEPSLSQVLLSYNIYRKVVSSEIVAGSQRLGHGLSYNGSNGGKNNPS